MPFSWTIVGGTGYDVEDVDHPRTHDMVCPSCEKRVRFTEKLLIKNLRVFGVPLVGVERGKHVFECPRCQVCIESPPDGASLDTVGEDPAVVALRERLARAEDEVWVWKGRAEQAGQHGDQALAHDALQLKVKAEREVEKLRATLADSTSRPRDIEARPAAAIVARAGGEPVDRSNDLEFAALKKRVAQ